MEGINYFIYARKSSESEDRQMASIEDQINEMLALAKRKNLKVVDIISESKSAKNPGLREGFNSMIKRLYAGEADGILSWKLNRLARNPVDGGQISWILQQGVIKHLQTYSGDYKPTDNVLMMQVEFGVANQFIRDLSIDSARGLRQKAERGWYPGSVLPIGYKHNTGNYSPGGEEIVTDNDFAVISDLWNKMKTGHYSVPDIKRYADSIGFTNHKGGPYALNTYYKLFTNEFYSGYFTWSADEGKLERFKGKHKALITEEEFNKVQILLGKRGKPTRANKLDFAYRGPIFCGECGCSVTAENKLQCICDCKYKFSIKNSSMCPRCSLDISEMKKPIILNKTYYHCTKKRNKCSYRCSQGSVEEIDLEKQIKQKVAELEISKDFYDWALKALDYLHGDEMTNQKVLNYN
jgi:site-specific DNA recombinase